MVTSKIPVCTPSRIKSTNLDVSSRAGSNQSINNTIVRENEDLAPNVDSALDATPDESDAVMVLFRQRFPDFPMDRTFTPEQKTYFGNYLAANHIPTARQYAANAAWQQLKTQSDLQGGIMFEQQRQQQAAQAQRDAEEQVRMHAQRHSELNVRVIDLAHQRDTLQQTWAQHQYRAQRVEALDELQRLVFEHSTVERQLHQQAQMQVQAQEEVRRQVEAQIQSRKAQARLEAQLQAAQPQQASEVS
ncbi:hypothetical protein D6D20_09312 [Aureobasidium pullulans]|uniref:Uncharacterized protein n=1 Tax=Aureobasidium pullulans TaxID=5580 RepID=A0A4S8YVK5_AURPU|nr:hypothetical protein D6D20_09312 [Aureobasidium pullulans]